MQLQTIYLKNFRNIEEIRLDLAPRLNVFIGENGQGKTNFLEAVYILTEGTSFRYGQNSTLIQFKTDKAFIHSFIHNKNLDYKIQIAISDSKKEVLINEKKNGRLIDYLSPCVLFSPESLSVIKESSEERRELLDQLVEIMFSPGRQVLAEFKKALRTRNKILKDYRDEKISRDIAVHTLESLNQIYFKLAQELTYLRLKALNDILKDVKEQLQKIDHKNTVEFDYEYIISDQKMLKNFDQNLRENIEKITQKRALELASAELSSGASLVGPQKHDVIFLYNGNDSRFFCSQGQQRSIILAFKMAQIVYHQRVHGFYPILLLDDVLSELDENKQEALILALNQIQTQTFITTTDASVLQRLNMDQSRIFKVRDGKILD